uniref:L-serine ammonia-lyase n=1 Tax=Amphora coffeiformis TaxID=265554 RepID=A0A7S3L4A6_9STRA|mmetsp:Transcript_10169/g.19590  ORF Transcript_10169/g.19590 Transcript_10169/m.19590 type:complete len:339 (+) Transcript_10169:164-1180(+)|eukprot:scaffold7349_cov173-Amphora_coffeaeformis.AAC.79
MGMGRPIAMAAAVAARQAGLFQQTPLIKARTLSQATGKEIYFKLDNLQASGSFKDRGMAHLCHTVATGPQHVQRVISSSGGNAGLAVATVAPQLGLQVDVYVPETTKPIVIQKLESLGATVTIHGANWNAADSLARERVQEAGETCVYVSPYDNPLLWTGHSTVVDEILQELPNVGAIAVSVGGGGLLCGVLEGLQRYEHKCRVIAAETTGANCFAAALQAGQPVRLDAITSVATSLGALETTPATLERAQSYAKDIGGTVQSMVCTDAQAVQACLGLAADVRLLVEPACGSALAVAYDKDLFQQYLADVEGPIVLQVCGGSGVSIDLLRQWKTDLGL